MAHHIPDLSTIVVFFGLIALVMVLLRRQSRRPKQHEGSQRRKIRPLDGPLTEQDLPRYPVHRKKSPNTAERGAKAEFQVASVLSRTCGEAVGDVYLPSRDGTTQIDHIGRRHGLIVVVETKSLHGQVEASATGKTWKHVTKAGERTFQNPLHQNYGHLQAVRRIVGNDVVVVGIVAIVGRPFFTKGIPRGVVHLDALEQRIVEMSDGCGRAEEAHEAMVAIRTEMGLRRWDEARRDHRRTVQTAMGRSLPPA